MKDAKFYLIHILECIENIQDYTKSGKEEFVIKKIIQDAVIRNLKIIDEATKKIPSEIKAKSPNVPWGEMAGLRDVLIHDYMGVDLSMVWNVIEKELPKLKEQIKSLI